jgi:hemoglobin-like flavoprotein
MATAELQAREDASADEAALLARSLETLAGRESRLVTRFYDVFFERHPEVVPLFGEHGLNEREEMLRETLTSVCAHADDAPWLDENLQAMGRSHAEYGVEDAMYPGFVETMLDTLAEIVGADWCPATGAAWRSALERLTCTMRRAAAADDAG